MDTKFMNSFMNTRQKNAQNMRKMYNIAIPIKIHKLQNKLRYFPRINSVR